MSTHDDLHVFVLCEGGCVYHWAVAHDAEEARQIVLATATVEEVDELEVIEQIPDDRPHRVHLVDGFDEPDGWRREAPPGAEILRDPHRAPVIVAPAGVWARFHAKPCYTGCSEY